MPGRRPISGTWTGGDAVVYLVAPRPVQPVEVADLDGRGADFARDRAKFLGLLGEIQNKLKNEHSQSILFLGIKPEANEIVVLRLAQRFGFPAPPMQCTLRPISGGQAEHVVICNSPRGGGQEVITATLGPGASHGPGEIEMDLSTAAARLLALTAEWIHALESLPRPRVYPAFVRPPMPGVDPVLARDSLWVVLNEAVERMMRDQEVQEISWSVGMWPIWVEEIDALVRYEEFGGGAIFAVDVEHGSQRGLIVYHPTRGGVLNLAFEAEGRLRPDRLGDLRARLVEWREVRALGLLGRLSGPTLPTRSRRTASGAKGAMKLSAIPPLEPRSGKWISSKDAAKKLGISTATLANYRSAGSKSGDGLSGIDSYGHVWRKATEHAHPRYLRSSLAP
jgi:hypothetical protein